MINPWKDIGVGDVAESVSARRISPEHPVDLFWAKEASGALCFLADNIQMSPDVRLPQLAGVEMVLAGGSEPNTYRIVMRLRNSEWWQVFYMLCYDIVQASLHETRESFVLTCLSRLSKWQSMLRLLTEKRLSQIEIQGLWGELLFMRKYLAPKLGWMGAVKAWKGPLGQPQDFGVGDCLVEIKTIQNTGRKEVLISSLDQLDPVGGRMYLHVIGVSVSSEVREGCLSLNGLVESIRVCIGSDVQALDLFDSTLTKAGYVYDPVYDKDLYNVVAEYTYDVRDDFPRICKSRLPSGVESGTYRISLGKCEEFLNKPEWMEH